MDARRWRWLVTHTGETTTRGMARACGVTHTTVQRWLSKGIPMRALTELLFKFDADPVEAVVAWGYMPPELVEHMNWKAFVRWVPFDVLVDEIHRRETAYAADLDDRLRKRIDPGVTGPLRLHDSPPGVGVPTLPYSVSLPIARIREGGGQG
jgi:hypothetical protein